MATSWLNNSRPDPVCPGLSKSENRLFFEVVSDGKIEKIRLSQGLNRRTLKIADWKKFLFFFHQRRNSHTAEHFIAIIDTAPCHAAEDCLVGDVTMFTGEDVSSLMYQIETERRRESEAHT